MRKIPFLSAIALLAAFALAAGCASGGSSDYDVDDNGLIEIAFLEQLDAVRWDVDGDGAPDAGADADAYAAAFSDAADDMGCPAGCRGYELARSLDFADAGSYASGAANTAWTQDAGWLPIGTQDAPFAGVFDGGGGVIANLFIDRPDAAYVGLFSEVAGEIRGLGLEGVRVAGGTTSGAFAGANSGTISDSYVTGEGAFFRDVGGFAGANFGTISGSYADVSVSALNVLGGFVGTNYAGGRIEDCYAAGETRGVGRLAGGLAAINFGSISGSYNAAAVWSSDVVGGLVGLNQGPISASYNTGTITGVSDDVGGLAGVNYSPISRSYSTGDVSGGHRVGGLVGNNVSGSGDAGGAITESYSTGDVSGAIGTGGLVGWNAGVVRNVYATGAARGSGDDIGGLVGRNRGELRDGYATGPVSGYHRIGGLVGYNDASGTIAGGYASGDVSGEFESGGLLGWNRGEVSDGYASGAVSGKRDVGGFAGENSGTISASYWDAEASGQTQAVGYGSSAGAEGKTTAEFARLIPERLTPAP